MVVPQPLRWSSRAAALALAALLLAPALLVQTAAQEPSLPDPGETDPVSSANWLLRIPQGEVKLTTASGRQVWFLDNRSTAVVQATVLNYGGQKSPAVPVYFWLSDLEGDPNQDTLPVFCDVVEVPEATLQDGRTIPGRAVASWDGFVVPASLTERGWNVTASVNQEPMYYQPDEGATRPNPAKSRFPSGSACPSPSHSRLGQVDGIDPVDPGHVAHGYFVKMKRLDLRVNASEESSGIRWCRGNPTKDGTCDPVGAQESYPFVYNRTVHSQTISESGETAGTFVDNPYVGPTYFQVDVVNDGTWQDVVDHGSACRCAAFPYDVRVVVTGHGYAPNTTIAWGGQDARGVGWQTVGNITLREKAGLYTVNVTLDPANASLPKGRLPEVDDAAEANNRGTATFEVQWVDFAAAFNATDFRTDPAEAYEYTADFNIAGDVVFENLGPAPLLHPENTSTGQPRAAVGWKVWIPGTNLSKEGTFDADSDDDPERDGIQFIYESIEVNFSATSVPGNTHYVRPGKHVLVALIDTGNRSYEPNESNNRVELEIYVQDENVPIVRSGPLLTAPLEHETGLTSVRPREPFAIRARVDDDDKGSLKVVARFTLEGNASHQRNYTLTQVTDGDSSFHALVGNFTFAGAGIVQNWTYVLDVTDVFGNKVTTSPAKRITLEKYPLQSIPEAWIVRQYDDGTAFNYADSDPIAYQVRLWQNWTGVLDQSNYSKNLFMYVKPVGAAELNISAGWKNLTECTEVDAPPKLGELPRRTTACNPGNDYFSHFQNVVSRGSGEPGVWNVSMRIMDASGESRWINRTLHLTDQAPRLLTQQVLGRDPSGAWREANAAEKGQTIWINATFTDDQPKEMQAYLNLTRSDGRKVNHTLTPRPIVMVEAEDGSKVPHFTFNTSLKVGQGFDLGVGGDFQLSVAARDSTGNWLNTPPLAFKINDTQAPTILEGKVSPAIQEVGQDFTFAVRAVDETNVTATVSIQSGDTDALPPVEMTTSDGQNFTYVANLSVEGNYAWKISVVDSLGKSSEQTGTLAIRDNLGPRFEVRSPGNEIAGERYGPALPRLEIIAFDSDTVDVSSVALTVDGQPVVPEVGPPPAGMTGMTLSYQVPSSRRFQHGETVEVNVTATDGSAKKLQGWHNFTFRVDDVAPTARLVAFAPQYRAASSQDWNVSLETRFTLAADDNDGLPTDVAAIRYRILAAGANSGENVYSGPFRITDAPGVYRGPTAYTIQYWAEDSAGNVNTSRQTTKVYVDDAPPELIQYFPQGRFVNATFVDDRVGVARAVAWHRVNGEPYQPLILEAAGNNLWKGVVPEARKGDRVSYYLQAWDHLNNTQTFGNASEPKAFYNANNHEPNVRIVTPVAGSVVSNSFNLDWNASDQDGDALTFTISVKQPGKPGYTELAKLDSSEARRYPVDSRRYLDGQYAFRVSASDGGTVKHSEVAVTILNRDDPLVGVTPVTGRVAAGGTVLLKAEVAKAEALVEARLYRDGELVGAYAMNDEGKDGDEVANDGVYSVRAPVGSSGDYSVEIFTRYEQNGETKTSSRMDAITFSAVMTPGYVLQEYAVLLVLIGLAAVVAIGVAAWLVVRKRR